MSGLKFILKSITFLVILGAAFAERYIQLKFVLTPLSHLALKL